MTETISELVTPRIAQRPPIRIAGFSKRFSEKTMSEIPKLWEHFDIRIAAISAPIGADAFGVAYRRSDGEPGFRYIAGVQVGDASIVPDDFDQLQIPAGLFAVFPHSGHVSELTGTIHRIWTEWLPGSGYEFDDQGEETVFQMERYTSEFNPASGLGGMDIWFPIRKSS